jgi:aspartate/methionine/tyrosine aminotransferase
MRGTDVGGEVVETDPTHAGLLNRIRLARGVSKFVPLGFAPQGHWRLDPAALRAAVGPRTRAMLLMSPSTLSGGLLSEQDWPIVAQVCTAHDQLPIVDAAMERLPYEGREVVHPASFASYASAMCP